MFRFCSRSTFSKVCRVTTLLLTVGGVAMYWKGGGVRLGCYLIPEMGSRAVESSTLWQGWDRQRGQTGGWRKSMWGSGNRVEVRQVLGAGFLMAMSVNKRSLDWLWTWAGGRWSCRRTGVMWRMEGVRVMIQAAEFWTSWRLWRDLWERLKRSYSSSSDKAVDKDDSSVGGWGRRGDKSHLDDGTLSYEGPFRDSQTCYRALAKMAERYVTWWWPLLCSV